MNNNNIPHPLLSEFHHEMDMNTKHFPEDIVVFIPTYGRVGKQMTINSFPRETWGVNVFLVAPADEDHDEYPVLVHPEEIDSISKKRQWIMEYARDQGLRKVVVADDNLNLKMRRYDKPEEATLFDTEDTGVIYSAWQFLSNRLEHIHVAQMKSRFFGQLANQMTMTGAGGGSLYAYRVDTYFSLEIDTSELKIYEDIHTLIEFARAGYGFLLYGDIIVEKKLLKGGGNRGVPSYSDAQAYNNALHEFAAIHSDFVKVIEMKKPYDNRPTNYACKFNWRAMRKHIEKMHEPSEPTIFDMI